MWSDLPWLMSCYIIYIVEDHHVPSWSQTKKTHLHFSSPGCIQDNYLLFRDTNLYCSVTPLTTPPKSVCSAEALGKTPGACSPPEKGACGQSPKSPFSGAVTLQESFLVSNSHNCSAWNVGGFMDHISQIIYQIKGKDSSSKNRSTKASRDGPQNSWKSKS